MKKGRHHAGRVGGMAIRVVCNTLVSQKSHKKRKLVGATDDMQMDGWGRGEELRAGGEHKRGELEKCS